jgi:hypothetical protein
MVGGREAQEPFGSVVSPGFRFRQDGAGPILLNDADGFVDRVPHQGIIVGWPPKQLLRQHVQRDPAVVKPGEQTARAFLGRPWPVLHDAIACVVDRSEGNLKQKCSFVDRPPHLFPEVFETLGCLMHVGMVSPSVRSCRVVRAFADVRARVQTHSRRDGRCHTVRLVAGGFFGPTPEFDAFVAEYISPVMREAGFKQAGFRYTLRGDDKSAVVVGVRLHTPAPVVGFMIRWAAIPRVLREFYVSQNPNWRPADKWGLVSVDTSPPRALWSVDYRTNVWQYAPDSPPLPEHRGCPASRRS